MPLSIVAIVPAAAIVGALAWTEKSLARFLFAFSAVTTVASMLSLATGDMERAALLSALFCAAIIGASQVKFHHSARVLIAADFPLAFAGTVPFFFAQYRRMMIGLMTGAAVLVLAAIAALEAFAYDSVTLQLHWLAVGLSGAASTVFYGLNGGATAFRKSVTEPSGYISAFMASLVDVWAWWPSRSLSPLVLEKVALDLLPPQPAQSELQPDIILIQHESLFDPRLFGLAVEADVAEFLAPPDGISGALNVEIFGGGSWQSEFSVLTGIPSSLFGMDAYYLFQKGAGRFRHSLPFVLSALGYRTMLASSCRRGFLNYAAFYDAIGMDRCVFSDDLPAPFDVARFEQTYSDAQFLPAALAAFTAELGRDPGPRFLYALTNFNHGPHNRSAANGDDAARRRAFAAGVRDDAEYAEFYARLGETVSAWRAAKSRLTAAFPMRPMLVIHYGDHQPVCTRRIEALRGLAADPARTFRTFYAVEALNFAPSSPPPGVLDIADLGTAVMQMAGLPLDAITATRAAMLDNPPDAVERDLQRRRLLKTLVDQRLVEAG